MNKIITLSRQLANIHSADHDELGAMARELLTALDSLELYLLLTVYKEREELTIDTAYITKKKRTTLKITHATINPHAALSEVKRDLEKTKNNILMLIEDKIYDHT